MNNKLLTVIIPVYNSERYLNCCLDSVINQQYTNLQIIVVNDGSSDSSSQIIEEYAAKDSRFVQLHKTNGGIGSAYKVAFSKMRGDYITFVDSDDYLSLDAFKELMSLVEVHEPDMVHFGVTVYNELGEILKLKTFQSEDKVLENKEGILKNHFEILKHPTLIRLYRKELFNNVVVFEQNIGIDEMLTPQLLNNCNKAVYTSKSYYNIIAREDSVCRRGYNEKRIRESIKVNQFVCSFMEQNIPEYASYSATKYINTLYMLINDLAWGNIKVSKELNSELTNELLLTYNKINKSSNYSDINLKVRCSIFLMMKFPVLYNYALKKLKK